MTLFGLSFEPFRDKPGWFVCTDPRFDEDAASLGNSIPLWPKLETAAKELSSQASEQGYQVFCGFYDDDQRAHRLFAIEGIHPCQLAREFRVGSHDCGHTAFEEGEVLATHEQITGIYQVRPFRPYFVDAAGYHCIFAGRITEAEAVRIEGMLKKGLDWYASREGWSEPIASTIVRENELHLWWD